MGIQMSKFIEIMRLFLIGATAISLSTISHFFIRRTWKKLNIITGIILIILWLFFSIYTVICSWCSKTIFVFYKRLYNIFFYNTVVFFENCGVAAENNRLENMLCLLIFLQKRGFSLKLGKTNLISSIIKMQKEHNMESIIYVGMDVHKDSYSICCYNSKEDRYYYEKKILAESKRVIKYL